MTLERKCNSQIIALRYEAQSALHQKFYQNIRNIPQFFKPVLVSCHHVANCTPKSRAKAPV